MLDPSVHSQNKGTRLKIKKWKLLYFTSSTGTEFQPPFSSQVGEESVMINEPPVKGVIPDPVPQLLRKTEIKCLSPSKGSTDLWHHWCSLTIHKLVCLGFFLLFFPSWQHKNIPPVFAQKAAQMDWAVTSTQNESCGSKGNSAVKCIFTYRHLLRASLNTFLIVSLSTLYSERLQIGSEILKLFLIRLNFLHYQKRGALFSVMGFI